MVIIIVNKILSVLTIGSGLFIVVGLIYFLLRKNKKDFILSFFVKNGVFFAFLVSFFAATGSFFYSEVAHFEPCSLCIIQRIFLFPQIALLLAVLITKNIRVLFYSLLLSLLGGITALYHIYISYGGKEILPCSAGEVSCLARYVFEFGFVTIPLMSLLTFFLIIFFLFLSRFQNTILRT